MKNIFHKKNPFFHANTGSRMNLSYPGFYAVFNDKIHFFIVWVFKKKF